MSEVLVCGGSIPALVAALDLAELGIGVRIADVPVTVPSGGVHDPSGAVTELLERIAAPITEGGQRSDEALPVRRAPERVCVRSRGSEWKPQPEPNVWGVPAVPISSDSIGVLGTGGALRAYLDRLKPVLTIGKQPNFGKLVESRMGATARELLTEPLVYERFGVESGSVDVALAAPGLNESLTVAGSLSGAVMQYAERQVARETTVAPAGGWERFAEILRERLMHYGAERADAAVTRLTEDTGGVFIARDDAGREAVFQAIIVSDASAVPGDSELAADLDGLWPTSSRVHIEAAIHAPAAVADAAGQLVQPSLQLVTSEGGHVWAVRATERAGAGWVAELSGAATSNAPQLPSSQELADLLTRAGLTALDAEPRVRVACAPFATQVDRDRVEAALERWRADHAAVVLASEELFAGDLGAALEDARELAVRLRRKLIGISE